MPKVELSYTELGVITLALEYRISDCDKALKLTKELNVGSICASFWESEIADCVKMLKKIKEVK